MLNIESVITEAREHEAMLGCASYSWFQFFEDLADHLLGTYDVDMDEFKYFVGKNTAFFKVCGESVMFEKVSDWYGVTKGFEIR